MPLPNIRNESNYHTVELPSNAIINIRPFTFGEEKNFLIKVGNKKDQNVIQRETINLLRNCVKPEDIRLFDSISKIDFIYLTIQMRKITRGSTIEYEHMCKCKFPVEIILDLNEDVEVNCPNDQIVELKDGEIKILIKQVPLKKEIEMIKKFQKKKDSDEINQVQFFYEYLLESVEKLIYEEQTYDNFTNKELDEFLNNLNSKDNSVILSEFAKLMPSIKISKEITCFNCKKTEKIEFDGLNFFLV